MQLLPDCDDAPVCSQSNKQLVLLCGGTVADVTSSDAWMTVEDATNPPLPINTEETTMDHGEIID